MCFELCLLSLFAIGAKDLRLAKEVDHRDDEMMSPCPRADSIDWSE